MRKYWQDNSKTELSRPEEIFIDMVDMRMMLDPMKRLKGTDWEDWISLWLYEYYSPITGKPFEPWHKEFSPGNGYFVLLTNPETTNFLWQKLDPQDQANYLREYVYFMYYRTYGETSTIAEGIYAGYVGPWIPQVSERKGRRSHREIMESAFVPKLL